MGRIADDFAQLERFRRELVAHCYRMMGSAEEAEDLVQETYLRAWRSYSSFEGRSSARTWLYRIATNVCLTALETRARRPLPSGLGQAADDPDEPLQSRLDVPWLRPIPDSMLAGVSDPAAQTALRSGIRLAFVAALQFLSARQRAMLIMRDVLAWPADEVAECLGTTATAVHSGVRRARAELARVLPAEDELAEPGDPERRAVLERFIAAITAADADAMAGLLRADVVLEMPPLATWFAGAEVVTAFVARHLFTVPGALRLVPTSANEQPAVAVYQRGEDGSFHAHAIQVLTMTTAGIGRIVAFSDPSLFDLFGLPAVGDFAER